jgi:hypothetical protein
VSVWSGMPITDPTNAALLDGRTRISSYAGYGHASYELPYGFKLIAGVRTSYEQRSLTAQTNFATDFLNPAVRGATGLPPLDASKSWTAAAETVRRTIRDANRATEIIRRLRAMFANRRP